MLPLLLMVACATPRVTTVEERALASTTLSTIETGLVLARISGKISTEDARLVATQINKFREMVTSSITHPMDWTDLYHQILNMGVQWAILKADGSAVDSPPDAGGSAPVDDQG
tara:strand:+ start:23050 stop:23391 length:342 start_codon:yes stop_codon:yes gene_type:complete